MNPIVKHIAQTTRSVADGDSSHGRYVYRPCEDVQKNDGSFRHDWSGHMIVLGFLCLLICAGFYFAR